jgi:hypothetical protein
MPTSLLSFIFWRNSVWAVFAKRKPEWRLDYGLDNLGVGVRFQAGARDFCFILNVEIGFGTHPARYTMGTLGCVPAGREAGDVTVATRLRLVLRLRMRGAISPQPQPRDNFNFNLQPYWKNKKHILLPLYHTNSFTDSLESQCCTPELWILLNLFQMIFCESSNDSDLYLGGTRFECRSGHRLCWLRCFVVFFSPSRKMPG